MCWYFFSYIVLFCIHLSVVILISIKSSYIILDTRAHTIHKINTHTYSSASFHSHKNTNTIITSQHYKPKYLPPNYIIRSQFTLNEDLENYNTAHFINIYIFYRIAITYDLVVNTALNSII